jgi:8-oxo-dGTP pyrophosphatase MutT (NUDIX family)
MSSTSAKGSAAAPPRPAATVVLLRPSSRGPEILMVRRARKASFMADAFVFPGGRVEPSDGEGEAGARAAAARELLEEAGVTVDPARLVLFAHWITPSVEPRRFDARFYVAAVPADQTARHDMVETVEHRWGTAAELLAAQAAGELKLPPPTQRTLEDFAPHATVEDGLAWARGRAVVAVMPKLVPVGEALAIVLPWDPEYERLPGEGALLAPDQAREHARDGRPTRFVLKDGRWWGEPPP